MSLCPQPVSTPLSPHVLSDPILSIPIPSVLSLCHSHITRLSTHLSPSCPHVCPSVSPAPLWSPPRTDVPSSPLAPATSPVSPPVPPTPAVSPTPQPGHRVPETVPSVAPASPVPHSPPRSRMRTLSPHIPAPAQPPCSEGLCPQGVPLPEGSLSPGWPCPQSVGVSKASQSLVTQAVSRCDTTASCHPTALRRPWEGDSDNDGDGWGHHLEQGQGTALPWAPPQVRELGTPPAWPHVQGHPTWGPPLGPPGVTHPEPRAGWGPSMASLGE